MSLNWSNRIDTGCTMCLFGGVPDQRASLRFGSSRALADAATPSCTGPVETRGEATITANKDRQQLERMGPFASCDRGIKHLTCRHGTNVGVSRKLQLSRAIARTALPCRSMQCHTGILSNMSSKASSSRLSFSRRNGPGTARWWDLIVRITRSTSGFKF